MIKRLLSLFQKEKKQGWVDLTGTFTKSKEELYFED